MTDIEISGCSSFHRTYGPHVCLQSLAKKCRRRVRGRRGVRLIAAIVVAIVVVRLAITWSVVSSVVSSVVCSSASPSIVGAALGCCSTMMGAGRAVPARHARAGLER